MLRTIVVLVVLMSMGVTSHAQLTNLPDKIEVSPYHTVYIVFNSEIELIDIGTGDFIYQKPDTNGDMIFLKAADVNVEPTSIMIRTKNKIYVSTLVYTDEPDTYMYDLRSKTEPSDTKVTKKEKSKSKEDGTPEIATYREKKGNRNYLLDNADVKSKVWKVLQDPNAKFFNIGNSSNGLFLQLTNIYVDKRYFYIKLAFENTTSIGFDIDFLSMELEESGKTKKRAAIQSKIMTVKYYETVKSIPPNSQEALVYVIDSYAFENKDNLIIRVNELEGERALEIKVKGKELLDAERL